MPGLVHGFRGAGADPRRMQLGVTESMLLDQDAVVMQWLMAIEATGMSSRSTTSAPAARA